MQEAYLTKKTKIKLVRQKDQRVDLYSLYCNNYKKFLEYQSEQPKDVFNDVDYIVSFIGEEGLKSRFIGVYKIKGKTKKVITRKEESFWYDMEEVAGFEDLKEKVIVNWMNPISWHQWNTIDKETIVVEIHPGLHYQQFTDYLNVLLNFKELEEIVIKQYIDWKRMLSATKGIYLISDISTGKLYVGSAYGEEGIWGRWAEYVKTNGHGGNKTLKELISNDPKHAQNFQFSILMITTSDNHR